MSINIWVRQRLWRPDLRNKMGIHHLGTSSKVKWQPTNCIPRKTHSAPDGLSGSPSNRNSYTRKNKWELHPLAMPLEPEAGVGATPKLLIVKLLHDSHPFYGSAYISWFLKCPRNLGFHSGVRQAELNRRVAMLSARAKFLAHARE